ncbi:polysaccharide deacetylase family protein [bacterium]|nr:polysaccharide deacetylase family protein [bacterium]
MVLLAAEAAKNIKEEGAAARSGRLEHFSREKVAQPVKKEIAPPVNEETAPPVKAETVPPVKEEPVAPPVKAETVPPVKEEPVAPPVKAMGSAGVPPAKDQNGGRDARPTQGSQVEEVVVDAVVLEGAAEPAADTLPGKSDVEMIAGPEPDSTSRGGSDEIQGLDSLDWTAAEPEREDQQNRSVINAPSQSPSLPVEQEQEDVTDGAAARRGRQEPHIDSEPAGSDRPALRGGTDSWERGVTQATQSSAGAWIESRTRRRLSPAALDQLGESDASQANPGISLALGEAPLGRALALQVLPNSGSTRRAFANSNAAPTELTYADEPPRMPQYDVSARIKVISRGNAKKTQVALTFDDGPHPEYTSQLLAVLDFYDVPATFFFVGVQAAKYPHWVKMAHQAGHEIASQTYDHFRMPKLPLEEKIYQIDEYQRLIEGLVGVTPRFLRPPGGQLDEETRELLAKRGMVTALWDVALNDTAAGKTAQELLRTTVRQVRPGSVILAHDGIQATIDTLPRLIEELRARGYEFVTLSDMAETL